MVVSPEPLGAEQGEELDDWYWYLQRETIHGDHVADAPRLELAF